MLCILINQIRPLDILLSSFCVFFSGFPFAYCFPYLNNLFPFTARHSLQLFNKSQFSKVHGDFLLVKVKELSIFAKLYCALSSQSSRRTWFYEYLLILIAICLQWRQSKFILRGRNSFPYREGDEASTRVAVGFFGRGQWAPSPPARGFRGASSPSGSGAEPRKIWNFVQLETSRFTTEMPYNVQVATERLKHWGGEDTLAPEFFYWGGDRPQDRRHCLFIFACADRMPFKNTLVLLQFSALEWCLSLL